MVEGAACGSSGRRGWQAGGQADRQIVRRVDRTGWEDLIKIVRWAGTRAGNWVGRQAGKLEAERLTTVQVGRQGSVMHREVGRQASRLGGLPCSHWDRADDISGDKRLGNTNGEGAGD